MSRLTGVRGVVVVVIMAVVVVTMRLGGRVGGVIVMAVVVVTMSLGDRMVRMTVRDGRVIVMGVIGHGRRGVVVVPVRVVRDGGMIVMTRMAVVVVRLVLVAHLGSVPSRCSAVIAAKSV